MKSDHEAVFIDWENVLLGAVINGLSAAAESLRNDVRSNLTDNQSEATGTREGWSEQTKLEESNRQALIDSVLVEQFTQDGKPTVIVTITPESSDVARFLEFERVQVFWGRETDELSTPQPFMRPAYDNGKNAAIREFARGMAAELK